MHRFIANLSYVGNCAVAFGERERTAIFSVALRPTALRDLQEKRIGPDSYREVFRLARQLADCFFLAKQKEKKKITCQVGKSISAALWCSFSVLRY